MLIYHTFYLKAALVYTCQARCLHGTNLDSISTTVLHGTGKMVMMEKKSMSKFFLPLLPVLLTLLGLGGIFINSFPYGAVGRKSFCSNRWDKYQNCYYRKIYTCTAGEGPPILTPSCSSNWKSSYCLGAYC